MKTKEEKRRQEWLRYGIGGSVQRKSTTTGAQFNTAMNDYYTKLVFIRFGSHRARDYGFRALQRRPQGFYSWTRPTYPGGVYKVTEEEIKLMRTYSGHARFTVLRGPYDDLMECW